MRAGASLSTRLTLALAGLLLAFGAAGALLAQRLAAEHAQEAQQRRALGLAAHIAQRWPALADADPAARAPVIGMLQAVNPGVQVYLLDRDGRVLDYLGEPGMVRTPQVDLAPVHDFLRDAALPLRGTDPMGSGRPRIFSAAMFPAAAGRADPRYLYVVLDGGAPWPAQRIGLAAGLIALATLGGTGLAGAMLFRALTQPLRRLARRMQAYGRGCAPPAGAGDEIAALERSFDDLTTRLARQTAEAQARMQEHRETMAGIAHDLRTPLTALHGQLEALADPALAAEQAPLRRAALAQSDRLRRLTQQLFELATLQGDAPLPRRERFRLDELVMDTVQQLAGGTRRVSLVGRPPGPLEVDGDLQLVERALGNLIDNARRHAGDVQVQLQRADGAAQVWVEDGGPGLPHPLHARLAAGEPLRDPPLRRADGGLGGLGLAIAQRVALLHGGSLRPLPAPDGGTRLCLALPLAAAPGAADPV
jgi:signal transduction histidine kinase